MATFNPTTFGHEQEVIKMIARKYQREGKTFVKPERWNFEYNEDADKWILHLPEGDEVFKVDAKNNMVQIIY